MGCRLVGSKDERRKEDRGSRLSESFRGLFVWSCDERRKGDGVGVICLRMHDGEMRCDE